MAKAGPQRARGSYRGRGQRRPPTWEISDSDTEGASGAEADSEATTRARDPAKERRVAAEALRLLRPERALRRLTVLVDPGAPKGEGRGPVRSCSSAEPRVWNLLGGSPQPTVGWEGHLSRLPLGQELAPAFQLGSLMKRLRDLDPIALLKLGESVCL